MRRRVPLVLFAALLAGCLEREETIVVAPDGALEVRHRFKGDPGEFGPGGDALPSGAPWTVTDQDLKKDDGKVEHVREAKGRFASAGDLPRGFGPAGDTAPLAFTTSLTGEKLGDGSVRWTFERRYPARAWAWRQRLFERHFPDELQKKLGTKGDGPADPAARREALTGLLAFERAKHQALLEQALAVLARPGEDAAVAARRALRARTTFGAAFDREWKVAELEQLLDAPAGMKAFEARYDASVVAASLRAGAEAAAAEGGAGAEVAEALLRPALELARRTHQATEDLQDESFALRVTFPGKVVLSDAGTLEDGGRTAVWRWKGAELSDRELVLRAVAVAGP